MLCRRLHAFAFGALLLSTLGAPCAAEVPIWPAAEWQTVPPEQEGMDSADLAGLVAFGKQIRLDSLLIARHGQIVLDASYAPYSAALPHVINSSTKAVRRDWRSRDR